MDPYNQHQNPKPKSRASRRPQGYQQPRHPERRPAQNHPPQVLRQQPPREELSSERRAEMFAQQHLQAKHIREEEQRQREIENHQNLQSIKGLLTAQLALAARAQAQRTEIINKLDQLLERSSVQIPEKELLDVFFEDSPVIIFSESGSSENIQNPTGIHNNISNRPRANSS